MGGNLWEWTSTLYRNWDGVSERDSDDNYPYPYDADHGRENEEESGTNDRVMRGGAYGYASVFLRGEVRYYNMAGNSSFFTGVRCARSYE